MKVSPRDYARNNRRWSGELPITAFDRLMSEISTNAKFVEVELAFSCDENDHIRMKGRASATAEVACHRCSEMVPTTIHADIDARIVRSEQIARDLSQEADVIVVTDNPVSITDLVEDDLIMSIPWRVCDRQEDCPNFAADEIEEKDGNLQEFTQKPFANLRQLLDDS